RTAPITPSLPRRATRPEPASRGEARPIRAPNRSAPARRPFLALLGGEAPTGSRPSRGGAGRLLCEPLTRRRGARGDHGGAVLSEGTDPANVRGGDVLSPCAKKAVFRIGVKTIAVACLRWSAPWSLA